MWGIPAAYQPHTAYQGHNIPYQREGMTMKHDTTYNEAMDRAEKDFRTPDGLEMRHKCPYIYSSNMADAYWITAHALYDTGRKPIALHKSRGYKWTVDYPGLGKVTAECIQADHREGIRIN
jgi:hypothetical protein